MATFLGTNQIVNIYLGSVQISNIYYNGLNIGAGSTTSTISFDLSVPGNVTWLLAL